MFLQPFGFLLWMQSIWLGNWSVWLWQSYLWKDSPGYDHILTTFQEGTECNPIVTSDCLHCIIITEYRLSWVGITNANLSILFFSDSLWLLMDSLSLKKVSLLLKQVVTFKFNPFQNLCLHKRAFSIQFISFRSWTRMFKICGHKPLNIYLGHYASLYYLWILSVFPYPLSTV